jgi:hypothetical protein
MRPKMKIHHAFFGSIDASDMDEPDTCWSSTYTLGNSAPDVWLWIDREGLDSSVLDAYAALLQNFAKLDADARAELVSYLQQEQSANGLSLDYMHDHLEKIGDSPAVLAARTPNGHMDTAQFVQQMKLHCIGLWCTKTMGTEIIMDYMIDAARSDQILAVKIALGGEMRVIWES